ncbi:MAG: lactate dehydrogenase, partial [Acidaminobacteraceae bacterium]
YKEKMFSRAIAINPKQEKLETYILKSNYSNDFPGWIKERIKSGNATFLEENYLLDFDRNIASIVKNIKNGKRARLNILGLGDVGGILLIGLRLLGSSSISSIGIFDLDQDKLKRWEAELNQIIDPNNLELPDVDIVSYENLFDCDMFVFCASKGVPPVGSEVKDVRKYQLASNSKLVSIYAKEARKSKFKGIFAVVSDPVDQLCYVAYEESNKDYEGNLDYKGLLPEQVRGYGLGVMYARSLYYLKSSGHEYKNSRAYGPHGKELVIANDIESYDDELSKNVTYKTVNANMDIRGFGYKPFIAPALSSGALSIINTLTGKWHYSAVYLDGCYFGVRNRLSKSGMEIERSILDEKLASRITDAYKVLKNE